MLSFTTAFAIVAGFLPAAQGVTPIPAATFHGWVSGNGIGLALAAQPMWFFGQAMDQPPCYPTNATNASGCQTPSAGLCDWPNVGCGCRTPGVDTGNRGPAFPVYFTWRECSDSEVRVVYNVFWEKDGFNPDEIYGHAYDWERVVVIWTRSADASSWEPAQLMLSQHSGYQTLAWADIQNTLNIADATQNIGGPNGRQNLDHPKVYVAWSKHAMYDDRNTGWNDPLAQLTDAAFRSQDWWYFPTASDYLRSDLSTALGKQLAAFDWRHATSDPPGVDKGICSVS